MSNSSEREIKELLHFLKKWKEESDRQLHHIMNTVNQLSDAVTALNNTTSDLAKSVDAAVTDIQALGPNDQQLQALTQSIGVVNSTLQAQAQRLNDAVNPPAPAPAPAPTPTT